MSPFACPKQTWGAKVGDHHHLGEEHQALVSKEVFNSEMGDVLFSLTADGAVAARARELAGVPLIAAELRKNWWVSQGTHWLDPRRGSTLSLSTVHCVWKKSILGRRCDLGKTHGEIGRVQWAGICTLCTGPAEGLIFPDRIRP